MAEPLGIAVAVVGISGTALHCVKTLYDDLQKIIDAPEAVRALEIELTSIDSAIQSIKAIERPQWEILGPRVVKQSESAIETSITACRKVQRDLDRWTTTLAGDGDKLSWRSKATIGWFQERRVKAASGQLQSCQQTLTSVVGVATFYSSLRNCAMTEELMQSLATKRTELEVAIRSADAQVASAEQSLAQMRLADQDEQSEDEQDMRAALWAVEAEVKTFRDLQATAQELIAALQAEKIEHVIGHSQSGTINASFGANNRGLQFASNTGQISGVTFGSR